MFVIKAEVLYKICTLLKNIYESTDYVCKVEADKFVFYVLKANEMTKLTTDIQQADQSKIKDLSYKIDINRLSTFARATSTKDIKFKTLVNKLVLEAVPY